MNPAAIPNPDPALGEEKRVNVGLDMSVLDNRLNVTVDYYNRRTKDLHSTPIPYPYRPISTLRNSPTSARSTTKVSK